MNKISVERMMELEAWLTDNRPDKCDRYGAKDFFLKYFNEEETEYLVDAFIMPFQEIKVALNRYDSSHPKMDELAFIGDLQTRYYMTSFDIFRRIRQVRKVMRYLVQHPFVKFPIGEGILIGENDEWREFINQDRESTEIVAKALNYEERKKALALKYNVLKQMAEYNGLSLDDIREEADKIKENDDAKRLEKK